jgi:hypothetical protein
MRGVVLLGALGALSFALAGCAGELPKKQDASARPESGYPPDVQSWTASDRPRPREGWPAPGDSYQPAPFGCELDDDCFGQRCCPTPWGVKLCAPECELR